MRRKAVSPGVATVILVAVAITVAVAVYGVMTGSISKGVGFLLLAGTIIVLVVAVMKKDEKAIEIDGEVTLNFIHPIFSDSAS